MSTHTKATPRPWKAYFAWDEAQVEAGNIVGSNKERVVEFGRVGRGRKWICNREAKANAGLIVKAVNAYEPMLEVLKESAELLDRVCDRKNPTLNHIWNICNQAILTAEGKGE